MTTTWTCPWPLCPGALQRVLQWTGKGLEVRQTPCGDTRMEMHKHSYTPRDPDTGAEARSDTGHS